MPATQTSRRSPRRDRAAPPAGARIPVQYIGQARQLRNRLAVAYSDHEAAAERLIAPFRARPGFAPMPPHAWLRALAQDWRALPGFGRLRLFAEFDREAGLRIAELRVVPSRIKLAGWTEDEPAVAVELRSVVIRPPDFKDAKLTMATAGLHGLARRYQRDASRDDASVLRDLFALTRGVPRASLAGGEFAIPAAGGGRWIGSASDGGAVLVRTFVD